jgi:hypothetical protein
MMIGRSLCDEAMMTLNPRPNPGLHSMAHKHTQGVGSRQAHCMAVKVND